MSSNRSKPIRRWRRLPAALVLSIAAVCAAPAAAVAKPAYGGTAPEAGSSDSGTGLSTTPGERARVLADGTAQAPQSAPDAVKRVIAAGNRIATLPYRYGGGHALLNDTGYDCSGSVSYALRNAGLFRGSADATGFFAYGQPGPGRWITTYANGNHMYMVVAGVRFDTSGRSQTGSRWQAQPRSPASFTVRHPTGL